MNKNNAEDLGTAGNGIKWEHVDQIANDNIWGLLKPSKAICWKQWSSFQALDLGDQIGSEIVIPTHMNIYFTNLM